MRIDSSVERHHESYQDMTPFWHLVLIVFCDNTDLWWLRFLKCGFRHCFVVLCDGRYWVTVDPLSHYSSVAVHEVEAVLDIWPFSIATVV